MELLVRSAILAFGLSLFLTTAPAGATTSDEEAPAEESPAEETSSEATPSEAKPPEEPPPEEPQPEDPPTEEALPEEDPFGATPENPPQFFGLDPDAVAGVTRSSERVEDAPGLIAVVGEREIRERGYRTLADLLADVPGFYVEPDERRDVVLTRGVPQSVLIVYDGIPLIFDTGRDDLPVGEELSLAHVRRVEVLRGPGTALWGANAFHGIVNVLSSDGRDLDGTRVHAEVGSREAPATLRAGTGIASGRRGEEVEWFLSARVLREGGSGRLYRDTPRQYLRLDPISIPVGETVDGRGASGPSVYGEAVGKVRWRSLELVSRWSDFAHRGALSSYSHSLLEKDRNEQRRVPTFSTRAAWREARGPWNWVAGVFYLRSLRDDRYPLFARTDAHRFGGEIDVRALTENFGADARGEYSTGAHTLSGGIFVAGNDSTIATDYVSPTTGTRSSNAFRRRLRNDVLQLYVQDRIVFAEAWRLTLGASFDDQSDFTPSINPRAGLVVRMGGGWIGKALYGEAIRTPDAYDLIGISGGTATGSLATVSGNPDLSPEKVRTAELAAEYRRGTIATGSLAAFASLTDDLIEDSADGGVLRPVNRGRRYAVGTELLGSIAPSAALSMHGAYTFVRTAREPDELGTDPLPSAPEHVLVLGGSWSPHPAASVYVGNRFVARRRPRGGGESHSLGPYSVTDLNLRFAPIRWPFATSLKVRNLLDTSYRHRNEATAGRNVPVEIPGERRSVLLIVEGRF